MSLAPPLPLHEAAAALGIKPGTLYKWLAASKAGSFRLGGEVVTIQCLRTGKKKQGKALFPEAEIVRLQGLMTDTPHQPQPHRRAAPVPQAGRMPLGIPKG